jgi:hypothetical protein
VVNPDDVALLKEELAQFLLTEIASAQGGTAFRREVGDQVGVVIDQILAERLKPALDNLERSASEQSRAASDTLDAALARVKAATPTGDSPAVEQKLSEMTAALDQLRQRIARIEETPKPARLAVAQPMQAPGRTESKLADERIAAPTATASSLPRWMVWLLLILLALSVLGLANLYYEKLSTPAATQAPAVAFTPPPVTTPSPTTSAPPPATTPTPPTVTPAPPPVSVPPQNTAAIAPVTPKPAPTPPATPQPAARIPADFAIERGWLAAQPYAVEPRLARHLGLNESFPTLRSLVCGSSANCASDALIDDSMDGKQLVALQMLMSQIGDRFCVPRRSVAVTGKVSASGLADLAAIASCAGGATSRCTETQNRVCPPDPEALQSGSAAARATLMRWALWKTGST